MRSILRLALFFSLASLASGAAPGLASADTVSYFRATDLPESLQYRGSKVAGEKGASSLQFHHQKQQIRSLEAPTRYRTRSILRYSRPLGETGLVLRIKAPLKKRQQIRLELRF